ncbi:hypothetical protein C0Q70_06344 [Pomacea canaliculata]|uniref:Uncharacterized protein n=1 Tax=Pomacea canaliculata TaxID=400727 RepID=A0A2T7PNR5_POMCA|nr:hypothetical protein C0Q70_06344 [Pomacea canaliculata]
MTADDTLSQTPQTNQPLPQSPNPQEILTPVEKLILAKLDGNGANIDKVTATIERMESTMLVLQQEVDRLKRQVTELRKQQEAAQADIEVANSKALKAENKSNANEQYSRNYNIRIYYVAEPEGETIRECQETVLKLFREKLGVKQITERDLDAVHRQGRRLQQNQPRPIIVCFVSRKSREERIKNRKKRFVSASVYCQQG